MQGVESVTTNYIEYGFNSVYGISHKHSSDCLNMVNTTTFLSSVANGIKNSLRLHFPLWIMGTLGFFALFLPDTPRPYAIGILFFGYFLFRYLWRRHLKKQDQLGKASSGVFSLLFWGMIGLIFLYDWLTPDAPKLAVYVDAEMSDQNDDSRISRKHGAKKGLVSKAPKSSAERIITRVLVRGYVEQEGVMTAFVESKIVELE